jgi:type IV secretory pathway TraG/TraD family ATPase VirD4
VPLVADLDEVGNVVKLEQLPEWYSFFGSMGIVVSAYFQTRGQGMAMLERTGWNTLWSAAAIRVYGGGSDDTQFLESLSKTIGQYDAKVRSSSTSRNGSSRSVQTQRRDIMSISQLSELPASRAWVKTSTGAEPSFVPSPGSATKPLTPASAKLWIVSRASRQGCRHDWNHQ